MKKTKERNEMWRQMGSGIRSMSWTIWRR